MRQSRNHPGSTPSCQAQHQGKGESIIVQPSAGWIPLFTLAPHTNILFFSESFSGKSRERNDQLLLAPHTSILFRGKFIKTVFLKSREGYDQLSLGQQHRKPTRLEEFYRSSPRHSPLEQFHAPGSLRPNKHPTAHSI